MVVKLARSYVYQSNHVSVVQRRAEWFEHPSKSPFVLWWVDAGHIPTEEEGEQRLEMLWQNGPSPEAFTFRTRFKTGDQHGSYRIIVPGQRFIRRALRGYLHQRRR